jgi:hypothetical protein
MSKISAIAVFQKYQDMSNSRQTRVTWDRESNRRTPQNTEFPPETSGYRPSLGSV